MPDSPETTISSMNVSSKFQPVTVSTGMNMSIPALNRTLPTSSTSASTMVNGHNGHSPSTVNGGTCTTTTPSPPDMSNQQLPPACGARQLSKLKRFLTTLQQFGNDISPEIGEKVRGLVMGLVNSTLSIEEFHAKLQETTNFPLRPFVIPFLKANLPLLQRELIHCARIAKQTPQQYISQNEHILLDTSHNPIDSSDLFSDINENGKRRTPDRPKENGTADIKRHCKVSPGMSHHLTPTSVSHTPQMISRPDDLSFPNIGHHRPDMFARDRERDRERVNPPTSFHNSLERDHAFDIIPDPMEEDWKHVETMLNCIIGMVEKTKNALNVLRHRSRVDREELAMWARRRAEGISHDKRQNDMLAQSLKQTEDRVIEVKRKADDAVNEVKRQALAELQKAVAAAEAKANELVSQERSRLEQAVNDAKRQARDEAFSVCNAQDTSSESCWNCGRKANETCSGCNTARYCGSFCQHKDWENHHRVCNQLQQQQSSVGRPPIDSTSCNSGSSTVPSTTAITGQNSSMPNVATALTLVDESGKNKQHSPQSQQPPQQQRSEVNPA